MMHGQGTHSTDSGRKTGAEKQLKASQAVQNNTAAATATAAAAATK